MSESPTYSGGTYDSKNPIARFSHRKRFKTSLLFTKIKAGDKILDYGCGDGKFLNDLSAESVNIGYEPYMEAMATNKVTIYNKLEDLQNFVSKNGKFDKIVCFEVFEHLNEKNQQTELSQMRELLKPDGEIILSVPIEIGLAPIVKNIRRRLLHPSPIYTFKNILKSVFAIPLPEHRKDDGYLTHMGFNHKILEKLLLKSFTIREKLYSPFPGLGHNFNSQVFYRLIPK